MVRTLKELSGRLRQISNGIEITVNEVVVDTASHALYNVGSQTPVDTGKARSNWRLDVDAIPSGAERPAFAPIPSRWKPRPGMFPGGTKRERRNLIAMIDDGERKLSFVKTGSTVHISNHSPYIERLNDGYSPQSSAGFVERGINAAVRNIARAFKQRFKKNVG